MGRNVAIRETSAENSVSPSVYERFDKGCRVLLETSLFIGYQRSVTACVHRIGVSGRFSTSRCARAKQTVQVLQVRQLLHLPKYLYRG